MEARKRVLEMDGYTGIEEGEASSSGATDAKRLKEEQPSEEDSHTAAGKTIEDLPEEVLVEVFSFLPLEDLVTSVKFVCRRWREAAQDSRVFRTMVYRPSVNKADEEHVVRVLQAAPKLRWIVLSGSKTRRSLARFRDREDISEGDMSPGNISVLGAAVDACPRLERIDVIGRYLSGKLLAPLRRCRSLRTLWLDTEVTDHHLFPYIAEGCPFLEQLYIPRTFGHCDSFRAFLEKRGCQLTSLHLDCCDFTSCVIPVVAEHCTQLRNLTVRSHINMKGENFPLLFSSAAAAKLERLELLNVELDRQATEAIFQNCHSLLILRIECIKGIDEHLIGIEQLVNLRSLDLSNCRNLTDRGVMHVVECTSLRELILNGCGRISEETIHLCCRSLPNLHSLQMGYTEEISSDTLLMIPDHLKKLKHLTISNLKLKDSVETIENLLPDLKVVLEQTFFEQFFERIRCGYFN